MSSSPSTNELQSSRTVLEALERSAYRELGLPFPDLDVVEDVDRLREYLSSNPDVTPEKLAEAIADFERRAVLRANVVDLSAPATRSILNGRVTEIEAALEGFDDENRFARTCFGTVPGGGLDASSFKVDNSDEYAIVIPEGFFHLTNLLTKLVILLQPLTPSADGPVFMPTAWVDQFERLQHPYVRFRHRDLLEALFLWGNPKAALPYTRAIPYQDRFAYLLVGTELFVLAHELAHALLGHLDSPTGTNAEELELDADELALKIVTAHFRSRINYPVARGSLCGFLFISMVRMWEEGLGRLAGDSQIAASHTHPVSRARFERYASALENAPDEDTPPWYSHTHNAIKFLTVLMLPEALDQVSKEAATGDGISARVLPQNYQYLGHFNVSGPERWWLKIATMISSSDESQRRLGLWLLVSNLPNSAVGLYRGIIDEDEAVRNRCEAALVRIQPMYASYIPRLRKRYRETAQAEEFDAYVYNLSLYLGCYASVELGEASDLDPMDPHFFATDLNEDDKS